jgi:hypothetical protein
MFFFLPCIIVYQYSETNVMNFSFNFIKNDGPLHVSSATCSPLEFAAQTAVGILRACYVSWLHQDWSKTSTSNLVQMT